MTYTLLIKFYNQFARSMTFNAEFTEEERIKFVENLAGLLTPCGYEKISLTAKEEN